MDVSKRGILAGVLGVVLGGFGCSDSGSDGDGTAGTGATGGSAAGGSGGSATGVTDATSIGGQPTTGGMTGGGATASGGSSLTGGTQATGGAATSAGGSGLGGSNTGSSSGSDTGGTGASESGTGGSRAGGPGTGGTGTGGTGTAGSGGGGAATGGSNSEGGETGGSGTAGSQAGGTSGAGSDSGGANTGGNQQTGGNPGEGDGGTSGETGTGGVIDDPGPCTASQDAGRSFSGGGPHDVVVERNADPGINEGTIYRPADLGGDELYPIFVWGEGGCARDGFSNSAAMAEIASHGYFVVADGPPSGGGENIAMSNDVVGMGSILVEYIDWAITENSKPCSAYYRSLDTSKIAANGFSCGGLMAAGTAADPRMTTWGVTSSGLIGGTSAFYDTLHTPVLIVLGGASDVAYENGMNDYANIAPLGLPVALFSKDIGHGGDLSNGGNGDFTKINLAWLNWWLKGDEGPSGKGMLVGSGCSYCSDSAWEVMSANIP